MASTYTPIATTTLGSAAASVTFNSISGSYTDLVLVIAAQSSITSGFPSVPCRINSDSGTNYSFTQLTGDGSSATSSRLSSGNYAYVANIPNSTTGSFGVSVVQFMNYSNATTYKTIISRTGDAGTSTIARVNLWRNTAAITSLVLTEGNGVNFQAGSTFTLYGITAA